MCSAGPSVPLGHLEKSPKTYLENAGFAFFAVLGPGRLPSLLALVASLEHSRIHVVRHLDILRHEAWVCESRPDVGYDGHHAEAVEENKVEEAPGGKLNVVKRLLGGVLGLEPVKDAEHVAAVVGEGDQAIRTGN